ncbi:MAG TPA: hypothetical protein VN649_06085 [Ramlibacter sp.]|nr:hypothetical protein [Ramlibacter sp.]
MSANLWHGCGRAVLAACLVLAAVPAVAAPAQAKVQPGVYRCLSFNIAGGAGSCRLSTPIIINANGTYEESASSGTWRVKGNRIVFSDMKMRGPGLITGNKIVFEYDFRDMHHTVTYLCQECSGSTRPPAR